jgi:hypothetical protein
MKKFFTGFLSGIAVTLTLAASAASITITTTGAQDTRLVAAFTAKLQPGCPDACRNATAADVKAWIIDELQAVVRNYEYTEQQKAIATQAFTPS